MRQIVADLRSFTQTPDQDQGPADLGRALRWALQSTTHELRHRARVIVEVGPLPRIEGSEARLGQLFVNLLLNAALAITPGRAEANLVRLSAFTDLVGRAVVEVQDTGAGIPPESLNRIFDPFFSSKPSGVASGLGLSVCHGIVHSLGGEIAVDSQPGMGCTFRVVLPGASVQRAPCPRGAGRDDVERPAVRARVLVIDDEPLVRRAIVRSLEKEHDVISVATAAEALARLQAGEWFDLILCDLMMPEMTGMDMAARLKERLPKLFGRLVFLSGGAFTPESAEFLRSIGTRFVEKPFLPDELSRRVAELLITVRQEPTTDELKT